MRVVIPMAGQGTRFVEAGYPVPKPLIRVDGRPIIGHLLDQFPASWPKVFVCTREQLAQSSLAEELRRLAPDSRLTVIEPHTRGPVFTVLEATRVDPDAFPEEEPCLVNYCDFSFSWDPLRFEVFTRRTQCDGAVLCYSGYHPEYIRPTLYAYCREENGRLLEVREKGHFTPDRTREYASSGSYFFRSGALIRKYFARLLEQGPLLNGEGYVSLVYNLLIGDGLHARVFEIPWFLQWGTPADLQDYEYWSGVFGEFFQQRPERTGALQLLMPMAGRGERFGTGLPKFQRPILGRPMFRSAIDHLPMTGRQVLVIRQEHEATVRAEAPDAEIVALPGPTEGQAMTCAAGCSALHPDVPVLVSSCDHGLVWDEARWRSMTAADPDVIVFGQRGYSGADATPKAFAYIEADADRITRVSVKQPLSDRPRRDLLLVGTFWFRRPALLSSLIEELQAKNIRVNGELYLDSVVNLAVERGLQVRVFEADGYLCWGTPNAVREFEYWHGWFSGRAAPPGRPS